MVLVRMAPDLAAECLSNPGPQVLTDILWAASIPDDRVEHIRARAGPAVGAIDVALFFRSGTGPSIALALRLCDRAIHTSPALTGWDPTVLPHSPIVPSDLSGAPHDYDRS
jgi:hypothetical protein